MSAIYKIQFDIFPLKIYTGHKEKRAHAALAKMPDLTVRHFCVMAQKKRNGAFIFEIQGKEEQIYDWKT
ncbi:hypothetical protein B5E82_11585 [Lachnoclostridium sp. An138]|nr:hypothetical protein B5E82_11585 [Lachnoclostridium sp. An138]